MTDKPRPAPDDRELEQYLQGGSELSRRYREASGETPPPELDEAILAQARSELRRRPLGVNRWLAPVALAASVVLGINLGWNVYKAAPPPGGTQPLEDAGEGAEPAPQAMAPAPAAAPPAAPEAQPERKARQSAPQFVPDAPAEGDRAPAQDPDAPRRSMAEAGSARRDGDENRLEAQAREEQAVAAGQERAMQKQAAARPREDALAGASADAAAPAPLTEADKIERLIRYVAGLDGVAFIRNGDEHAPADAAKHMRLKLEQAGRRVKTADDFIRLCASFSTTTGEAYLMRYPDGRTRTAEDVLREQLAGMR